MSVDLDTSEPLEFIKLQNTGGTEVNSTNEDPISWNASIYDESVTITHDATADDSRIFVSKTGYYRVTFNIRLFSTNRRTAPALGIRLNGAAMLNDFASHTYARNGSGHAHSSGNLSAIVHLTAGDYIEVVGALRDGAGGSVVTATSGGSTVLIERLRDIGSAQPRGCALRVAADGTALSALGCTVSRIATGRYQVTFTNPQPDDTYPILITTTGVPERDDYFFDYNAVDQNGFMVRIMEQDNGSSSGSFIDAGFSVFVPKT